MPKCHFLDGPHRGHIIEVPGGFPPELKLPLARPCEPEDGEVCEVWEDRPWEVTYRCILISYDGLNALYSCSLKTGRDLVEYLLSLEVR